MAHRKKSKTKRKRKNPDGGVDQLDREDTTLDDYANVARRHPAVREVKFDGSIVEVDLNNGKWMLIAHPETLAGHYGSPFRTPSWVPDPEFWFGLWVMGEGDAHGSTLYNTPERLQNKLDIEGDYLSNPSKKRNPDQGWARGYGKPKLLPRSVDYWWNDGHGYEVGYEIGRAQGQRDSYGNWERGEMTPFATVAVDGPVADDSFLVEVYMGDDLIDLREVESTFDQQVKLFGTAYRSLSEEYQEAMGRGLDQKRAKKIWDTVQDASRERNRPATGDLLEGLLRDQLEANPGHNQAKRMMNPHNY